MKRDPLAFVASFAPVVSDVFRAKFDVLTPIAPSSLKETYRAC